MSFFNVAVTGSRSLGRLPCPFAAGCTPSGYQKNVGYQARSGMRNWRIG